MASEATANRVLNSLTTTATSVSGGRTVLDNGQRNDADVRATTKAAFGVTGRFSSSIPRAAIG